MSLMTDVFTQTGTWVGKNLETKQDGFSWQKAQQPLYNAATSGSKSVVNAVSGGVSTVWNATFGRALGILDHTLNNPTIYIILGVVLIVVLKK